MKNIKIFFQLLCLLISLSAFGQEKKDSISENKKKCNARFFISAGLNYTHFSSDLFLNYMYNKMGNNEPAFYGYLYHGPSSTIPENYNYNKSSLGPSIGIGLQLSSKRLKKINFYHSIGLGYNSSKQKFSYSVSYSEFGFSGPEYKSFDIHDNVQSTYNQATYSFGYKLQPEYKSIFLSMGFNCSYNMVKVAEQKEEHTNITEGNSDGNTSHQYTTNTFSNTTSRFHFINVPLEVGLGKLIKIKKITLKPAFYYSPNITKKYNSYIISLAILYK